MKCNLDTIEVNYEIYGSGKPILMLHGSPVDHQLMKGCMEPIFNKKSGYKRIYMDLPGMGKTKGENWVVGLDEVLDVILRFIDKIIPNENFLLAGQSYGGFLARGVTYKLQNKIDGLLLICPAILLDDEKRTVPPHTIFKKDDALLSQLSAWEAQKFSNISVVQDKRNWERFKEEILVGVQAADMDFVERLDTNGYDFSFHIDAVENTFPKPTLMLLGRQDSVVGYKDTWSILEKYPRATFAVLDKAGHNLQIEQNEVFNSLVEEWLTRVEEF